MAELQCPKCQSAMRSYERNGITVDQCTGCSGIFLDRGELERLIQAEDVHYSGGGQAGLVSTRKRRVAASSTASSVGAIQVTGGAGTIDGRGRGDRSRDRCLT